jgi:hypothetical protein
MSGIGPITGPVRPATYYEAVMSLPGLISWCRLGELVGIPTGYTARDLAMGNDGTITGSPAQGVAGLLVGDPNHCITTASGKYVSLPSGSRFTFAADFTLLAWVRTTDTGVQVITGRGTDTLYLGYVGGWSFNIPGGSGQFADVAPSGVHMIAGVRRGSRVELWRDAVIGGTVGTVTPAALTGTALNIGRLAESGSYPFIGQVQDHAVWNRALLPSELALLVAKGNGLP